MAPRKVKAPQMLMVMSRVKTMVMERVTKTDQERSKEKQMFEVKAMETQTLTAKWMDLMKVRTMVIPMVRRYLLITKSYFNRYVRRNII
jgi:hypothetical protein